MAGSKKGKNKKKKEKSNSHKSDENNSRQTSISNFNIDSKHEKEVESHDANNSAENEVESQLYLKIEAAYKEACKIILELGYDSETARKAILSTGYIVGELNILSSIMKNSLTLINSSQQNEGKIIIDKEPVFKDISELIRFWIQMLVNLVETKYPGLSKSDAMQYIMSSKSLDVESPRHAKTPYNVEASSSSSKFSGDKLDFDTLLDENVAALKRFSLSYTPELVRLLEMRDTSLLVSPQEFPQSSIESNQHFLNPFESDKSLNPRECYGGRYDEKSLEEWLKNSSETQKDEVNLNLKDLIESLEKQVDDRKKWAEKKVTEAIEKLRSDTLELNMLRSAKEEKAQKIKDKEVLATSCTTKILEKEILKRRENRQLDYINEQVKNLEAENVKIRADLAAIELNELESKKNLKLAMKKEKEDLKKIENCEKHISKAQDQINGEKGMILQLEEELKNIHRAQEEAKLKFKQEMEEKEQARVLVLEEKRLTRIARENASSRLSSLQHELDMEYQRVVDHKQRLMEELSCLKISQLCSPQPLASDASECGSSRNLGEEMSIPDHRRCILCFHKEVSVLFIPCAHQVVCFECSESVGDYCPSCQVQIAKQYRVYGGSS